MKERLKNRRDREREREEEKKCIRNEIGRKAQKD
jgi:hypothetical protein